MSLFGPPDVEKLKAKGDIKGLVKALGYRKNKDVRAAATLALGEIGAPAVEPLVAALTDEDVDVRVAAALALGEIGDIRVVEPLIAALGDRHADMRTGAATALGEIGDARAVEPLIAALGDQKQDVRLAAVLALSKIGAPAVEPLCAALGDHTALAALALLDIGDARAVEPLIAALGDQNEDVRLAAVLALGEIGDARAVEPLGAALKDQDEDTRKAAVLALGKIRASHRLTAGAPRLSSSQEPPKEALESMIDRREEVLMIDTGEIGVLFDIDDLGGFYRYSAFKVLFKNLDPKRLTGCTLLDGDTSETLAGHATTYCVAFQAADSAQAAYIREALGDCDEEGLAPTSSRFIEGEVTGRHPLVVAGRIDEEARLVVRKEEGIGQGWVEGTRWTVVSQ